ncbi:hypothetical protein LCGC14_1578600 [marine sediment metagenome]|uniref:Uncharacterized protein n=1 Tax=marine sediment metagenome TaxID=412755 RepID=A0A0F9IHL4_9ZZZZ
MSSGNKNMKYTKTGRGKVPTHKCDNCKCMRYKPCTCKKDKATNFGQDLQEELKDPVFKKAYEEEGRKLQKQ